MISVKLLNGKTMYSATDLVREYGSDFNLSQWIKGKKVQTLAADGGIEIQRGQKGSTFVNAKIFKKLLVELNIDESLVLNENDVFKAALHGAMFKNNPDRNAVLQDIDYLDDIFSGDETIDELRYGYSLFQNKDYSTALEELKSHIIGF